MLGPGSDRSPIVERRDPPEWYRVRGSAGPGLHPEPAGGAGALDPRVGLPGRDCAEGRRIGAKRGRFLLLGLKSGLPGMPGRMFPVNALDPVR